MADYKALPDEQKESLAFVLRTYAIACGRLQRIFRDLNLGVLDRVASEQWLPVLELLDAGGLIPNPTDLAGTSPLTVADCVATRRMVGEVAAVLVANSDLLVKLVGLENVE